MKLTDNQVEFVSLQVKQAGIDFEDLAEGLIDHICCTIENSSKTEFIQAYNSAIERFGKEGLQTIQKETILLTLKKEITMKRVMFIMGYIALFLSTTGLLFKVQHWPFASIILTLGIVLLNFGFLPMYFYSRYKQDLQNA